MYSISGCVSIQIEDFPAKKVTRALDIVDFRRGQALQFEDMPN